MSRSQDKAAETPRDYVARREALRILEVKPQTLYSYVSRGLIRRLNTPDGRISYYNRQDIERRKARSVARSGHGPAAASAIHWGEPLLTTAVTEITDQGPRYRDRLALDLARENVPYESVATYLWSGRLAKKSTWPVVRHESVIADELSKVVRLHPDMHIRQLLTEIVWLHGMRRQERGDIAEATTLPSRLLQDMTAAFGFLGPQRSFVDLRPGETITCGLARALGIAPDPGKLRALNAALVLVADHELTPATFAARIAASTGSDLYSCIAAAIQVQFGTELGLRCDRLEQRLEPNLLSGKGRRPDEVVRDARVAHELGVPIYPHGDPRAKMLVELALRIWASSEGPSVTSLRETASQDHFILDEGLVVLCRALGVQPQAAGGLLALGRTAGWIAHVLEQRQEQFVIRPRGKFVPGHLG